MRISTGDAAIDQACELAARTLKMNTSEKWGRLCPVLAPAWEGSVYPAWIHPYDNYWMNKVTPYLYPKEQVEWPIILFSRYQWPTGMIAAGVHDIDSPEAVQAHFREMGDEAITEGSVANRYIRDHAYIMQVHDLWWHYGDLEMARSLFPSCRKSFDYLYSLKDTDRDGLIETADIIEDIDVGSMQGRTGPNAAERFVEQSMLYGALIHYSELAKALGEDQEAALTSSRASDLAKRVNELYWNEKGYYIFAIDTTTHEPLHEQVTSTYGNGYGILWGLVPPERVEPVLDYFTGWEFEVPGPILVPPLDLSTSHAASTVNLPPGVYANGGCGWGRGYLPSGCRDYSETASAFLHSVIHGYFGLSALEPGWKSLRLAPKPIEGASCSISLNLPGGEFTAELDRNSVRLISAAKRTVEVVCDGSEPSRLDVEGEVSSHIR